MNHMARLDYNLDSSKGGTLVSFHCDYQDFLDENGLIDSEQAKQKVQKVAAKPPVATGPTGTIIGDDDDLEALDDPSEPSQNASRFRYDNVLKSMVARLELYGGLAPIQEYGRHQTQANRKKK